MSKRKSSGPLDRLKEGNRRFASDMPIAERQDRQFRETLVGGQQPFAALLSCADSRVAPELLFDAGLGELFVVRVAGNIANTCSIASLEYAVAVLKVKLVVVLGHQNCGAVGAALAGGDNGHHLNQLVAHLQPAVAKPTGKDDAAKLKNAVKKNARLTARALRDRSPVLAKPSVDIMAGYYNLGSGKVDFFKP